MKFLSNYMIRINNQLILTTMLIIVGSLVFFGGILPQTVKGHMHKDIYGLLQEEQRVFLQHPEIGEWHYNDVYHYEWEEGELNYGVEEQKREIIHHLMMYPDFFRMLRYRIQQVPVGISERHVYQTEEASIYYMIYKQDEKSGVVSYKVDNASERVGHQILMNTLVFGIIAFILMMCIFLKWTSRLINNLKEIQGILDTIETDNLQEDIVTERYTLEIQEVMMSLERMRKRLRANEEMKEQMLHNMSHDFKTPIAVIKNYAEGMVDGVYPYGTVEETASVIYNQADRLGKKVQGLLYLNRLDYLQSTDVTRETFEMSELIQEVVGYMQDYEADKGFDLRLEPVLFRGEREQWRVVLENIIDNAKRYAKTKIEVAIQEGELKIWNDGEPIQEDRLESIFKPFEKGKDGVTGLGLAIVKKTVELYGYSIQVTNECDGGVCFSICKNTL